ncbi:uncharacterized protein LY89DRAFT_252036 [Mollisia scopiformis]|uniref:Uncharacterized protein n=1 Tax=Mollisia scopiformis TaxID=149040 RepID=A0A194WSG9_MOLSC|nr:uncharacterized protein LY89DRAFT_252036 [Mollisia scopiformis]KUJ10908.1 hypothetical protein LY89DRAFT_252036 [Mollisia scopiformis]
MHMSLIAWVSRICRFHPLRYIFIVFLYLSSSVFVVMYSLYGFPLLTMHSSAIFSVGSLMPFHCRRARPLGSLLGML